MKALIAVCALFISFNALAAYTCNDRDYLKTALAQLDASCGGTSAEVCKAGGFSGSTVELAVDACSKSYQRSYCAQNVTCSGQSPLCKSGGFAGSSVEFAVEACSKSYQRSYCAQNVACAGNITICKSGGFAGSSVELAVDACSKSYQRSYCAQNVTCGQ
jgi:hypothetical protein